MLDDKVKISKRDINHLQWELQNKMNKIMGGDPIQSYEYYIGTFKGMVDIIRQLPLDVTITINVEERK